MDKSFSLIGLSIVLLFATSALAEDPTMDSAAASSAVEALKSSLKGETGFQVDKVVLTTDSAFAPTDTGPAESQQSGTGPSISIARNASGGWVITYTGTLVSAPTANGSYTDVAGATSPYTVTPQQTGQLFYRSKQ